MYYWVYQNEVGVGLCIKVNQFAHLTNNQSEPKYLNMDNHHQPPASPSDSSSEHQQEPNILQTSMKVLTSPHQERYDESRVYVGANTEREQITEQDHESSLSNMNNRGQSSSSWRQFLKEQRNPEGFESEYYQKLLKRKSPKEAIMGKHCSMPNLPGVAWSANCESGDIQTRIKKLEEILMSKFRQEAALTDRQENLDKMIVSEKLVGSNTVPQLRKQQLYASQLPKKRDKAVTHSINPESLPKLPRQRRCTSPLKNRRKEDGGNKQIDNRQSPLCVAALEAKQCSTKKKERNRDQNTKATPQMHVSFKKTVKKHKSTNRRIDMNSRSYEKQLGRQTPLKFSIREFISNLQQRVDRVRFYLPHGDLLQIQRQIQLMKIIEQMHSRVLKSIKCKLVPAEKHMLRSSKGVNNVAVSLRNRYG